jgi:phospho-N-acetylmuramoyl-pentapeptide-transferase
LLAGVVITGAANAVNLSDGLDGLAAGCILPPAAVFVAMGLLGTALGTAGGYASLSAVNKELAVFWAALAGGLVAFLKYNRYPAKMFMGEVGSQALGGALGVTAVLLHAELLLVIFGGVFVVEALSVIVQVTSYKLTGKRVFRMTPLHHHFELAGHSEKVIVGRFWIASAVLAFTSILLITVV